MKKVLVVGSKGFIGQYVYRLLQEQYGYRCWGCDVVAEYNDPHYITIDSTTADFNDVFMRHSFDYCVNCSGTASVPDSLQQPLRDFSLNTYNVAKLLEAIRRHAPNCRFIHLSSAAVYGNPIELPIPEGAPIRPVSPYGQHKLMAEQLCQQYYAFFGIGSCTLRIFSAYGPGLRKQLLWDVARQARTGDTITLFGTGQESRDFIYVTDIVQAIALVLERGDFESKVYNLASGVETTVREVAEGLLQALGYTGGLHFSGAKRSGDPVNWRADIGRLSDLGFVPLTSISQGIHNYVEWLNGYELR